MAAPLGIHWQATQNAASMKFAQLLHDTQTHRGQHLRQSMQAVHCACHVVATGQHTQRCVAATCMRMPPPNISPHTHDTYHGTTTAAGPCQSSGPTMMCCSNCSCRQRGPLCAGFVLSTGPGPGKKPDSHAAPRPQETAPCGYAFPRAACKSVECPHFSTAYLQRISPANAGWLAEWWHKHCHQIAACMGQTHQATIMDHCIPQDASRHFRQPEAL